VVIVALQDKLLDDLHSKLKAQYPQLEFRAVGVDLSGALLFLLASLRHANNFVASLPSLGHIWAWAAGSSGDYMPAIAEATDDIDVSLLFNNAGYIIIGVRSCYSLM